MSGNENEISKLEHDGPYHVKRTSPFVDLGNNTIGRMKADGLNVGAYDYMSLTQAALTDTYVYKVGGSGGTTVATVTVTFTDSTKVTISTVVKT